MKFEDPAAFLGAVVTSAHDAIVSKTLEGVVTSWNRAAELMFGYTAAEAIGRSITIIIPPERLHEEADILARLRRGESIGHFETIRMRKDGSRLPVSLTVSPVRDREGRVVGASKIARDISERRLAERNLAIMVERLEALYRLADEVGRAKDITDVCDAAIDAVMALGASRASVLLCDERGVMRFCGWRNLSDRYRAAVDGHSPWSQGSVAPAPIVVPDVLDEPSLEGLRDVIAAEGIRSLAFVPLVSHGQLLGKFMVYYDEPHAFSDAEMRLAGSIAQHVAFGLGRVAVETAAEKLLARERVARREAEVMAEVTERINASLDVHTTLERLVEGVRELCGGDIARIVVRDAESGKMLLRHQLGVRWDGYSIGMAIEPGTGSGGTVLATGRPFRTECYAEDPRITDHYREAARADGTIAQLVVPIRGESGVEGLLYVDRRERRPFTDADEAILVRLADQAATAIRNAQLFAAERAARAEADAANSAKDRFLAILSHELRTPLNAILGWARLLKAGHLDPPQHARALDVIERNTVLQAQLVSDLLDISRIAAGKAEIERAPVDLVRVVHEAIEGVTAEAGGGNLVTLATEIDEAAGAVLGEARRLRQVVSNLILNAMKFTPAGGRVDVRLARHETSARLTVSDTGEGIDPDVLPRIFDPFEQGDNGSTRRHQGLGLGLAIVRQFVELHGGTVRAESEGKGRGATFIVDLPVLAVRVGPSDRETLRARSDAATGLHGKRILIVDDQPDARELFALVLGEHGASVQVAGSANEALEILMGSEVDILVSDLSMPETDGFALIKGVRALGGRRIHAVAVTAFTGNEVRDLALASGYDAHATKPLNPDELVQILLAPRAR